MAAGAGVATNPPEASFVIDDRQRIIEWSNAAAATLGVPEEAALGRPCYEVVRGYDPFGRAVCGPNCPALKALRRGHLTGHSWLLRSGQGGSRKRFLDELVALPRFPGGALATLVARDQKSLPPASSSLVSGPPSFVSGAAENTINDLVALATLATSLSPDRLEQSLERALDWLGQAAGAEAAELFLAEPQGGDMLLSAYRGPFKAAFSQIIRFHPGEGFPGLILTRGEPIVTRNLREDPRYLRTKVKEKGFQSYVCVPLLGPRGVFGVLNLAARRPDLDLERVLRLLTWASGPISTVIQAGLLQIRDTVGTRPVEVTHGAERSLDGLLRAVLHQMMLVGDANDGALVLYDRRVQGVVSRVTEGEFTGVLCPDIRLGNPQACPALVGGHGMALSRPRHRWPAACQQVPAGAAMVYCLPLMAGGEEVGIVQLRYAGHRPSPPTKHLPVLLILAERAAQTIRQAWTNLREQERGLSHQRESKLEASRGEGPSKALRERAPREAVSSAAEREHPFLEIRCFGAFELYRQGKLVTPEMFGRRGALTLLKILLIQRGRPVSRDALAEYLWPEADPGVVANRLYVVVHALRRVVEPAPQGQPWRYICNDGDRYYFNTNSPHRLDIEEFREYVGLGERLERGGDMTRAIEAYEAAADLYRGDVLEDEAYAEWCWGEREHLGEICLDVLRKLAVRCAEQGALDRSIERYREALRLDPLREETYQGLMRVLWEMGRRDDALHQYQVCRDLLRRELDVPPLPETEQLYSLIRGNSEQ